MAKVKLKFKASSQADGEGSLYYQITHQRKVCHFVTDFRIKSAEWSNECSSIIISRNDDRQATLMRMRDRIKCDIERFARIIRRLEYNGLEYSATDIVDEFKKFVSEYSLTNYMTKIIVSLKLNGKIRTAETYYSTLCSFRKFLTSQSERCDEINTDITLDCINKTIVEEYESWLKCRGLTMNTVSFYNRILRAVYNRAVEDEIIEDSRPFRHVYTGVDQTVKRALPLNTIQKIKALDLSAAPALDFARNIFLLSFYLRGMSFIDMAFLKKSELKNGHITYRRHKTGKLMIVKWTNEMQTILDKYPENKSIYLIPIIKNPGTNERRTYRNCSYNINHNLKQIAIMTGITIPLTLYVARHSWASAAKAKGISISVISEGMGHRSEKTTSIYLTDLDTTIVDKANSIILKSLT